MRTRPHSPAPPPGSGGIVFFFGLMTGLVLMALISQLWPHDEEPDLAYYRKVRNLVDRNFVRDVEPREMIDNALQGLLTGLDPYSRYYPAEDLPRLDRETDGQYEGIGVVFAETPERGRILFALPGGPADRGGLTVGDRIVSIDGVELDSMERGDWGRALREPEGADHRLLVEDLAGVERELSIRPESVLDPTVRHAFLVEPERGIGYLAIRSFSKRTPAEFDGAIAYLQGIGLRALVLDLRDNPGGILESAVRVANRFLEGGVIVSTTSRAGLHEERADPDQCTLGGLPLVVLIDENSASASEVLAGALQDHRAAILVGELSYGKGTVQSVVRFDAEEARAKLTTAYYATPSQRIIERSLAPDEEPGIAPDLFVIHEGAGEAEVREHLREYGPPPEDLAAIEAWERDLGMTLIGHPERDPQLEAAVRLLRGEQPGSEVARAQ